LGQNPSLFTLQGTNTYFIQPDSPSAPIILVDTTMPTTADAWVAQVIAHLDALDAEASAAGDVERAHIAHLIITHRHIDHVGGFIPLFSALRARGAKPVTVWKMSNPDEAELATSPRDHDVYSTDGAIGARLAEVEEMVVKCPSGGLVHALKDGTHVGIEHPAGNVGVTAVHTPGHTADSVALLADGPERALVTGDTILGQGTTIFQDFAACK
jgi:glyoxylase-like metal-dependent hydrolase (beta-lactamase superfamily II)